MIRRILLACTMLLFTSTFLISVNAQPPMPPPVYYGFAYVGGNRAPDGLNVTAAIRGTSLAWTVFTLNGTKGNYKIAVPADDPDTAQKDGAVSGDTIEFYVNGTKAVQTAIWTATSGTIRLDLSTSGSPGLNSNASLTILADCSSTYAGYKVDISGRLTDENGAGISGTSLSLTYILMNGLSWNNISSVNTAINGSYDYEWTPPAIADYLIKARWEGNDVLNLGATEAYVNLATSQLEEKYVFSVVSNSTIFELAFNSSSRVLTFGVDGPSGTTGYANITIPKDLIGETSGLKVYLDGNQINYTAASTDTLWLLDLEYAHSTHSITVNLGSQHTSQNTSFIYTPLGITTLIGIIIVIVAIILIVYRKQTQSRKSDTRPNNPRK
jgi:hypothetical protein